MHSKTNKGKNQLTLNKGKIVKKRKKKENMKSDCSLTNANF